ncbi:hypothetical protein PR048_017542 [Dryococelus australis]|uniref:Uncharacterized protein n=1 Tax=Dryococelus australis TaxID=614101 RepID=A0ABQ9H9X0_9NEOP|nr:hypothetical protein PR048_017542 [Dryococelus australis]
MGKEETKRPDSLNFSPVIRPGVAVGNAKIKLAAGPKTQTGQRELCQPRTDSTADAPSGEPRGGVVVRLLASNPGEPVSIPGLGRSRIFAFGNRAGRCRWSAGFLGDLPFPPPLHSGAFPYSPDFTLIGSPLPIGWAACWRTSYWALIRAVIRHAFWPLTPCCWHGQMVFAGAEMGSVVSSQDEATGKQSTKGHERLSPDTAIWGANPLRLQGRKIMQGDMHRGKEGLASYGLHFGAMTTSLSVLRASLNYEEQGENRQERRKNPCDRENATGDRVFRNMLLVSRVEKTSREGALVFIDLNLVPAVTRELFGRLSGITNTHLVTIGATVAERLARSPPTKANRAQSLESRNRAGRCRWSAGFLGDLPFPRPFIPVSSIFTSIILIDSEDLGVKNRPNLFTLGLAEEGYKRTSLVKREQMERKQNSSISEARIHGNSVGNQKTDAAAEISARLAGVRGVDFDILLFDVYLSEVKVEPSDRMVNVTEMYCEAGISFACFETA